MLAGAGLSRAWSHDRAHFFFARARWNADDLGLAVARLVVALLVPPGEPVTVAIGDTLFRRRGKRVWAASWFHHGSAPGPAKTGYGNKWVIAAVVVRLPAVRRVIIVARFKASRPGQPAPEEIRVIPWPGKTSPHNRESRVKRPLIRPIEWVVATSNKITKR